MISSLRHRGQLVLAAVLLSVSCGYSGLALDEAQGGLGSDGTGGGTPNKPSAGGTSGGEGSGGMGPGGEGSGGDGFGGDGCLGPCPDREDFLLLTSFEDTIPGTPKLTNGGSADRATEHVHTGDFSLMTSQGQTGTEAEIGHDFVAISEGHLYFRAWIYIPDGALTSWLKLVAFHGGDVAGIDFVAQESLALEVDMQSDWDEEVSPAGVLPENKWFCLQIDVGVSDFSGSVDVLVDSTSVVSMRQVDTSPAQGISHVVYGICDTGFSQEGATIYWDDVAFGTSYIGCEDHLAAN